jgi:hypothetical protein
MAITRGRLTTVQILPVQDFSTTGLISNASGNKIFIRGFTFFNQGVNSQVVRLFVVYGNTTEQFMQTVLAPKETFVIEFPSDGIVLQDAGDKIRGTASEADQVRVIVHGVRDV